MVIDFTLYEPARIRPKETRPSREMGAQKRASREGSAVRQVGLPCSPTLRRFATLVEPLAPTGYVPAESRVAAGWLPRDNSVGPVP
jgi:hypothetical protein